MEPWPLSRRQFVQRSLTLAGTELVFGCSRLPGMRLGMPLPRLGFLIVTAELARQNEAFLAGLRGLGYVDGQTIHIDSRFAGEVLGVLYLELADPSTI